MIDIRKRTIFCIAMMAALTGCSVNKETLPQEDTKTEVNQEETTATPTAEEMMNTPTQEAPTNTAAPEDEAEEVKGLTYEDYDTFRKIDAAAIPCSFDTTKDPENWGTPYDTTGSYDLNQDGTQDSIAFHYDPDSMAYSLQVNDAKYEEYLPAPDQFYIVDLDTRDSYHELILYDDGMSGDPTFLIFRYDGTDLILLGTIGTISETSISFDGFGRVVKGDSFLYRLQPSIIPDYFELSGNELQYYEFDLSDVIGKEYVIGADQTAFFEETSKKANSYTPDWSEEGINKNQIELKAGDKLTLNCIGENEEYEVVLADGRTGIMYFWIGD